MASESRSRFGLQRVTWNELSGALGDLGTFVPLLLGLVQSVGLDLGTTLIATGIYNAVTGIQFGIPMPVQPMKTIAAVALSEDSLTIPELVSAGLSVSLIVFVLGITRGMSLFNRLVPFCLVHGIQLGVGLNLAVKGFKMVLYQSNSDTWRLWTGSEGLLLGIFGWIFILLTTLPIKDISRPSNPSDNAVRSWLLTKSKSLIDNGTSSRDLENGSMESTVSNSETTQRSNYRSRRIPSALFLVVLGIVLVFFYSPSIIHSLQIGPSTPKVVIPTWEDFKTGFWRAGLPQLPLTTLNSVVAVCKLSEELFPEHPANPSHVAVSMGAMNVVGTWFGVMPCCHGASGLAAQVKFGAKSGTAPVLLGIAKIVLGLSFGSSLLSLLRKFPPALLGAMLFYSGLELATSCRSEDEIRGWTLMFITATGIVSTGNTGIGFLIGFVAYVLVSIYDFIHDVFS